MPVVATTSTDAGRVRDVRVDARPVPRRGGSTRRTGVYLLLIVPAVVLIGALVVYPIVRSILTSFQAADTGRYVGLENYRRFFTDPNSASIVAHTFVRGIGGVVPSYLLGMFAALSLHQRIRGRTALRVLALVPFVISAPVGLNMWRLLLDPATGVPAALGWNLGDPLADPKTVWVVLLLINTWASFQFYTIVLLAGLARIPDELYEVAATDGATRWQRFRFVTLPGLGAVSVLACTVHFMGSFQEFNLIYILTGGGPAGVTRTLATYSYEQAFSNYDTGYATALTTISMLIMLLFLAVAYVVGRVLLAAARAARPADRMTLLARTTYQRRQRRDAADRAAGRMPRRSHLRDSLVLPYIGAVVVVLIALAPILFMVSRSLDGTPGGLETVSIIPRQWTLSNYGTVLSSPDLWSKDNLLTPPLAFNFLNSILVTAATTLLVLLVSMVAGYALSRWQSAWTRLLLVVLLVVQLVPAIVLVFPLYDFFAQIGLLGTLTGLVLALSATFLPLSTLLFKVFFDGIPREIEESAAIDGAGTLRILFQIVRPLAGPVIGSVAAFTLINCWNEYLFGATLISDGAKRTFPPALQQYMSSYAFSSYASPGMQAVFLLIPIFAAIVLLSLTQRHLAAAYQGGAVKG
ncbi:ABC transporter permease [Nakamurella endophytica]|uniref:ABC transmembrane type-1 domain-containing protein n=1 Tax=Nakamurella endophytica TaxID=1748367 RepID=A0A917WEZ4_9ACTN|nr:ABC transporter permease subunit [Nakamurella endophytica]GGL99475.1 hypothetical protein GCM10011594_19300 [Nakamurella endophytica]